MNKKIFYKKIALILFISFLLNNVSFAEGFFFDNGVKKWIDEDGSLATGWRWLDPNNDSICECYRFDEKGELVTNKKIKGREVNSEGQWVENGNIQKVYKSSGIPLYENNGGLGKVDTNEYVDLGSISTAKMISTKRKDMAKHILGEAELGHGNAAYRKSYVGPDMVFEENEKGYVMAKRAKPINNNAPVATKSDQKIIYYSTETDDVVATGSTPGTDMREHVSASNKYTKKVDDAKIYGGDIWNNCLCLQGNGAYVKFNTGDIITQDIERNKKKKNKIEYNYFFSMEIAHQTHGTSTADTYCGVEVLLDGKSVEVFDEFCDDEPEIAEIWLDNNEKSIELRLIVTGDAPGRKVYIRNPKLRRFRAEN